MQKIIEFKNEDWSKGISAQGHLPVGGLFQGFKGIDPFYNQGLATPSVGFDTVTPGTSPKYINSFNSAGIAYNYVQSDTKLYQVLKDSPYTQVDKTSEIAVTGGQRVVGATIWKGKYIYARMPSLDLRANSLPVATANDVQILASFNNSTMQTIPMCIGYDGNLYVGDNSRVNIITSATGTAGNSIYFTIDDDFNVRDLVNDGNYLVILADNNSIDSSVLQTGEYKCRIYFWDLKKSLADYVYDVSDSYLIAGEQLDGKIYFFGYGGLYVCSAGNPPSLIRPFVGFNGLSTSKPLNSYQLIKNKGSIYWIDGSNNSLTNGNLFAYGNPTSHSNKIFYQPHINTNFTTSNLQTVLQISGEQFWIGTAEPKIFIQNVGTTKGTAVITTFDKTMSQPFRYEYTKVVLSEPLSSGQSVICSVTGASGTKVISDTETKSYSAANPRQVLIFKKIPNINSESRFENIRVSITLAGASIQRMTVYATPLDDSSEDL